MSTIPIGYQKASISAAILITHAAIQGMQTSAGQLYEDARSVNRGFSVRFERGWSIECLLSVGFEITAARSKGYSILKPRVTVTWPSSRYDVVAAMAALALNRDVVEVATLIELMLSREQILDRDEKPEQAEKDAQ